MIAATLVDVHTPSREEIDELNQQAWDLHDSDPYHGLALSYQAEHAAEQSGYTYGKAYSRLSAAVCFLRLAEIEAAREASHEAALLFEALDDAAGMGAALTLMGDAHTRTSDFHAALDCYQRSLAAWRRCGDRSGEAESLANIGQIYEKVGQYHQAVEHYKKSLKLWDALGNIQGKAQHWLMIGALYLRQGEPRAALSPFLSALQIFQAQADRPRIVTTLAQVGVVYRQCDELPLAYDYLVQAHQAAVEMKDLLQAAEIAIDLGEVSVSLGDPRAGARFLEKSVQFAQLVENQTVEAKAFYSLGKFWRGQGDLGRAENYLRQAQRAAERNGALEVLSQVHEALADVCELQGNLTEALRNQRAFHILAGKLLNDEVAQRAKSLAAQYQIEKAQKDAEIHRLRTVELATASQDLKVLSNSLQTLNNKLAEANLQKSELLEQLRRQAELLEQQARMDGLTGLYNRRYLDEQLYKRFDQAQSSNQPLSLVMIDVDSFKSINDTFSHQTGDQLLRIIADLLKTSVNSSELVARYGGDEFVLVFPGVPVDRLRMVCEKIVQVVSTYPWGKMAPGLQVTVSVGAAGNQGALSVDDMLRLADDHLYQAKRSGKNQFYLS